MCLKLLKKLLRRKKGHVFLVQPSRMSKKKNNKNKGSIFKTKKPNGGIKNEKG